jgi:hypothetical protein
VGAVALIGLGAIGAGVKVATPNPIAAVAPGTARLLPGDAAVTVHRGTPVAAADALLRAGDTLTVQHGVAGLRTALGTIYATGGSVVAITSGAPRVVRGDVLVEGKEMVVGMRAATATINGAARIRQGLTLEVDVYRIGAVVRTAVETVGVGRLRRAIVAGNGSSLVSIAPLVINPADKWDRRFLGTAIELDAGLVARSRGLTMQAGNDASQVVTKVVDATGYTDLTLLKNEAVGELVVAAELAHASHLGSNAVKAALHLRSLGASWGLIALEQGLHALPAPIAGIDNVVVPVGSASSVAGVPVDKVTVVTTPEAAKSPSVTLPAQTPVTTPPTGSTPVTVPPATDEQPTSVVGSLVDGVGDLVGGLLGH